MLSIEDDTLVDGGGRHDVFKAPDDLESIFVKLPCFGDGSKAELVLEIVFKKESASNIDEIEVVFVLEMKLHDILDG